jgi:hypothetical protein
MAITHVSSLKNKKEKSEIKKSENINKEKSKLLLEKTENERKKNKATSSAKAKAHSSIASTKKESAHNSLQEKDAPAAPSNSSALDTPSKLAYRQLNLTTNEHQEQKLNDFIQKNRKWDFKVLDKQLEDIAIDMNFKSEFGTKPDAIRSFIKYFINYFEACDADFDNMLTRDEFAKCLKNDTFLRKIDTPDARFAAVQQPGLNYTNFTDYSGYLFDLLDSHKMQKLNFYDYMILRLLTFSWTKCSVSAPFIDESSFECAIELAAGWKTMHRNQVRKLYYSALEISGSDTIRNLDFLTYASVALSARLYGKINGKEDNDVSRSEMSLALDNNILPYRYNKDIIQQILDLTKASDNANQGIDIVSFVYYDFWLRIFDVKNSKKRYHEYIEEFITACSTPLYPQQMLDAIQKIPQNNLTDNSYQMYTYLNISNYQDESDHFLKAFIESNVNVEFATKKEKNNLKKKVNSNNKNNWSIKEAATKITKFAFDKKKTLENIFKIVDNDFDGLINFYDFGSFIQVNYIFSKFDKYGKGRLPAGQLAELLVSYSDFPIVSNILRERAKRFNLLPADLYVDLDSALLIIKIDDIIEANVRRSDKTTLFEIELKNILAQVNRKYIPEAYLNQCLRGNSADNIPLYDWECAFIQSEIRTLTYFENSMDYLTLKKGNLTLFNTVFVNKDSGLE